MAENELLTRQRELQLEASTVAVELNIDELLSSAGEPVRVGSAALGLMVWRDLDITVVCSKLDIAAVTKIASELMIRQGVRELRFLNDSGDWNTDPNYPDGFYIGLKYKALNGMDWTLDIWFVDEPDKQPDLMHIRTMPDRLTPDLRESILTIKDFWASRSEYGKEVKSYDIYRAVLDDNVRTLMQFQDWITQSQTKQRSESP
ncbi:MULTISPECIES: hypothetical protein [unclassified Paenibacillus]|uniref:hypothetical protein n=1 Tax=unclassified Paenibacillus TaxID=185978 RepID=UPI001C10F287|nr:MULTISPECIES: hypothetical protein [unclassified Paenibacillus]MBU5444061.1 hypothetical protein [Paenibacillus sp. MSJ-34]CAH0118667.1 hypothetical protein PAE9249_01159 [Paenibacillus sp. CECT 9249]